jgi:hypothetical protein
MTSKEGEGEGEGDAQQEVDEGTKRRMKAEQSKNIGPSKLSGLFGRGDDQEIRCFDEWSRREKRRVG